VSIQVHIFAEQQTDDGQWTPVQAESIGNPDRRELKAIMVSRDLLNIRTDPPIEQLPSHGGLPHDLSPEFQKDAATLSDFPDWRGWITLEELLMFDWAKQVRVTEWVSEEYADWFGDGDQPFPAELKDEPIFSPLSFSPDGAASRQRMVKVSWTETYEGLAGREFMEAISRLATSIDDRSRIRLVYWAR
jgi:hypothetical protein